MPMTPRRHRITEMQRKYPETLEIGGYGVPIWTAKSATERRYQEKKLMKKHN